MDAKSKRWEGPPVKGLREQQKAETRARVVEAARTLFEDKGYEATTIRMIAARAGVAPGSVFTTFESKEELLLDIILTRHGPTLAAMQQAAANDQGVFERLTAVARAAFEVDTAGARLFADMMSVSWVWSHEAEHENRSRIRAFLDVFGGVFKDGIAKGELKPDLNVRMATELFFYAYLESMRRAVHDGWSVDKLTDRIAASLRLMLDGIKVK